MDQVAEDTETIEPPAAAAQPLASQLNPRELSDSLARLGIEMMDAKTTFLRCTKCLFTFNGRLHARLRFATHWWKCPGGCNADATPNFREEQTISADRN